MLVRPVLAAFLAFAAAVFPSSASAKEPLLQRLVAVAPGLDPHALSLALEARDCAIRNGAVDTAQRLAVIDYSRPSTERRL